MAYSVDNIIQVNISLTPSGLGAADFNTIFFFSPVDQLEEDVSLEPGDIQDYEDLDDVADDWGTDSDVYLAASRWFAQIPAPRTFTAYVWDDDEEGDGQSALDVALEASGGKQWRYWYGFPFDVTEDDETVMSLADFADAQEHPIFIVRTDADLVDPNAEDTIADDLTEAGPRRLFMGYREPETVEDDDSQKYAGIQSAACFQKFNPEGDRTAITLEYQVLPGVVGESLSSNEYSALKDRNVVFWTQVELQGEIDASRLINSRSFSSYGEFIDDVVNIDILKNRLQVNGYNYIASPPGGRKRPLTRRGYAGLLNVISDTLKDFYDNGVLGEATYTDPETGEEELAEYGYVIFSDPDDVLDLSASERADREFPPVRALAILARAGHTVQLDIDVE